MFGARFKHIQMLRLDSPHLKLAANSQTSNLPPIPTRHRGTAPWHFRAASRRHRGQLHPVASRAAYPESNDLAMSRLRIRERIISSCVCLQQLQLHSTCVLALGQQPIEYAYWSVNRLGCRTSISTALCNRWMKLYCPLQQVDEIVLSIPWYLFLRPITSEILQCVVQ